MDITGAVRCCMVTGCREGMLPRKKLCLSHWMRVPAKQKYGIYRCLATLKKARKPELVATARQAHQSAWETAIKAVQASILNGESQ